MRPIRQNPFSLPIKLFRFGMVYFRIVGCRPTRVVRHAPPGQIFVFGIRGTRNFTTCVTYCGRPDNTRPGVHELIRNRSCWHERPSCCRRRSDAGEGRVTISTTLSPLVLTDVGKCLLPPDFRRKSNQWFVSPTLGSSFPHSQRMRRKIPHNTIFLRSSSCHACSSWQGRTLRQLGVSVWARL